ncbi:PulJ/GspJ family protein [Ectobacillus polymachus]|uniref:PulJ/GspJ family protein n=1 Tax=Ectobacillus polymachus TaxID=1508806 RepID=UPI003A84A19D
MEMRKNGENGLTLVEVLASITILSIITVGLFAVFPKSYSTIKQSQSKLVAVNIANGALHYMEKQDYDLLSNYLTSLGDGKVAIFDTADSCNTSYINSAISNTQFMIFPDTSSCTKIMEPSINNVTYSNHNVQIYIVPPRYTEAHIQAILTHIQAVHPATKLQSVPTRLRSMTASDTANLQNSPAYKPLHIFVYVDSNEKDTTEGTLLEGSINQ